jgi:hypothetical protein
MQSVAAFASVGAGFEFVDDVVVAEDSDGVDADIQFSFEKSVVV